MSTTNPLHLLHTEELGEVTLIRINKAVLRNDAEITEIFQQLDELRADQHCRRMVLSFRAVQSIASYFIGKLILLNRNMEQDGGRLVLCELTPIVEEIVDLMKLRKRFHITTTEQEALQALSD